MAIKFLKKGILGSLKKAVALSLITSLTATPLSSSFLPIGPKQTNAQNSCEGASGMPGSPGIRPGGVALNQAATFLANMSDYTGAYYDSNLDRIVFIGKTSTPLPKFNKDDLAVAIKSVIFNQTLPYVSLETQAGDTNHSQPLQVVFSKGLEDTKFGQIILDADYKMKQYSQGHNEDGSVLVSSVPGYKSFWQRYQEYGFTYGNYGSRWWITPKLVSLKFNDSSDAFIFDQVKMQILTEPLTSENSSQWNNAARDFAQQQTDLYDEFAKESLSYMQTKQLAQIVAVVKWIHDTGITTNFEWAKSYQPEYNPTPRTKTRLYTPWVYQGNLGQRLSGGAEFFTPNTYNADTGEAVALKNASQAQSSNKEDVHWTFTSDGQTYDSVAVDAEVFRSVGAYSTGVSDFSTSINDDLSLQVTRSYNSFSSAQNGIGKGWSFMPVTLSQIYWGPASIVGCVGEGFGYRKVALTFQNGTRETFEYRYCGGEYTAEEPYYHTKFFIKSDNSYFARTTDQTEYYFDTELKLTHIKDKNGNQINYTYDSQDKLINISDTNSHNLTLTYGSGNLISQIYDWTGRTYTYNYDASGNLVSVIDPQGGTSNYTYDENYRIVKITNRLNQIILENTYHSDGRIATQKDAGGVITTYSYNNSTNTVSASDNLGRSGKTIYDDKARVLEQHDAYGKIAKNTYGQELLPITVTDKNNNTSKFTYNPNNGYLTSSTDPNNIKISYAYNDKNNPTVVTDDRYIVGTSGAKVTNFTYDASGNNLIQTQEGTKTTKYTYNSKGQLISTTDPLNKTTQYTRDSFGNILTLTDPLGNVTHFTYDSLGRLIQKKDPDNKIENYTYDANNNLLTQTNSTGTIKNSYNAENSLIRNIDPRGATTLISYNSAQSPTVVRDALSNLTKYTYDRYQNLTSRIDALNQTTKYTSDKLDRRIQSTTPLGKISKWEYDANGNVTKKIDEENKITSYLYDKLNRLTKITYPDLSTATFTYDKRGNMLTATEGTKVTTFTYDSFDNLKSAKDPNNQTVGYDYNLANQLTKITYPDGKTVTYTYLTNGLLGSILEWNNNRTSYYYNKNGTLRLKVYPNGLKTYYTYDGANRILIIHHMIGSESAAKFTYTRDTVGNITSVAESGLWAQPAQANYTASYWNVPGTGSSPSIPTTTPNYTNSTASIDYNWDLGSPNTAINSDNFVARWTKTQNFDEGSYKFSVTSDDGVRVYLDGALIIDKWIDQSATTYSVNKSLTAGNHALKVEYYENGGYASINFEVSPLTIKPQTTLTYDLLSRLTSGVYPGKNYSYTYDKLGNRIESSLNGVTTTYLYNADSQLTQIGNSFYTFDAKGNQIKVDGGFSKVKSFGYNANNKLTSFSDQTTSTTGSYQYDALGNRLGKLFNNNRNFQYVNDLSGDLSKVLVTKNTTDSTYNYVVHDRDRIFSQGGATNTSRQYLLEDGLGNTRYVVSSTGSRLTTYKYSPYGEQIPSGTRTDFRFQGEQLDTENDLIYLRARYYDPKTGRFLSRDPVEGVFTNPQSQNPYAYALNNPINLSDPSGEMVPAALYLYLLSLGMSPDTNLDMMLLSYDFSNCDWGSVALDIAALAIPGFSAGALKVVNKATETTQILFNHSHAGRHLVGTSLTTEMVEAAIKADIARNGGVTKNGEFMKRSVYLNGYEVTYHQYGLGDGKINVGTYYIPGKNP